MEHWNLRQGLMLARHRHLAVITHLLVGRRASGSGNHRRQRQQDKEKVYATAGPHGRGEGVRFAHWLAPALDWLALDWLALAQPEETLRAPRLRYPPLPALRLPIWVPVSRLVAAARTR